MRIGILETGRPPPALYDVHGDYPDMFERLLRGASETIGCVRYAAIDGELPQDPRACDGWLITGSRHAVYEHLDWMHDLGDLARRSVDANVPIAGICFGHQLLGAAFGGRVEKSKMGWGLGVTSYRLHDLPGWMEGGRTEVSVIAVHEDQVVEAPRGAMVFAQSPFCPIAGFSLGDLVFTLQPHPEFDAAFTRDLLDQRLRGLAPDERVERALDSLDKAIDQQRVGRWLANFFEMTR